MVRTSMDVDVYDVGIHGWANNAHRTPSHLPSNFYHATSALMPVPSCLPNGFRAPQDDIQHLRPRESMVVATPRKKNSFHLQAPSQEEEAKHMFAEGSDHQIKTTDLPRPNHGFHVQSWLSCGSTVEGVTCLTPSEGAPIHVLTNLHRSVERSQLHQDRPLQLRLLSHWSLIPTPHAAWPMHLTSSRT
jgi:hypothetical protein